MTSRPTTPSRRKAELLEAAYRYALEHGLDELALLNGLAAEVVRPEHRPLLRLWAEAYARSLVEPDAVRLQLELLGR